MKQTQEKLRAVVLILGATAVTAFVVGCQPTSESPAPTRIAPEPIKLTVKTWEPDDPELARGKTVYRKTCSLCHDEGEEGAPRITRESEWVKRASQGEATLIKHAIEGFHGDSGEMPARGDNASFTDEEVTAAVRYMLKASQL